MKKPTTERELAQLHLMEVMAGFTLACILTLIFLENLHWSGKLALCVFVISFPAHVAAYLLFKSNYVREFSMNLIAFGSYTSVAGFIFMLANTYWPAAIAFTVSAVAVGVISDRHVRRAEARAGTLGQSPTPVPSGTQPNPLSSTDTVDS